MAAQVQVTWLQLPLQSPGHFPCLLLSLCQCPGRPLLATLRWAACLAPQKNNTPRRILAKTETSWPVAPQRCCHHPIELQPLGPCSRSSLLMAVLRPGFRCRRCWLQWLKGHRVLQARR